MIFIVNCCRHRGQRPIECRISLWTMYNIQIKVRWGFNAGRRNSNEHLSVFGAPFLPRFCHAIVKWRYECLTIKRTSYHTQQFRQWLIESVKWHMRLMTYLINNRRKHANMCRKRYAVCSSIESYHFSRDEKRMCSCVSIVRMENTVIMCSACIWGGVRNIV